MSAGKTLAKRSLLEPFRRDQFFWHPAAHPGSRLRSSCHHLTVSTGRQGVRGQRVGSDGRLLARRSGSRGGRHLARSSGRGGRRSAPAAKRCNLETVQRREPPRTRGCTSGTNGGLKMSAIRLYREKIEHPGHNDAALRRRRHEGRECQKIKNEGLERTKDKAGLYRPSVRRLLPQSLWNLHRGHTAALGWPLHRRACGGALAILHIGKIKPLQPNILHLPRQPSIVGQACQFLRERMHEDHGASG